MGYKSENNSMVIRVTDTVLKDAFLKICDNKGLHISNDGETKTGIEHIELGHTISVGTSDKFQVNWARNYDYYADRGIVPVYDFQYDWKKIMDRLDAYVAEQASTQEEEDQVYHYTTENGAEVEVNTVHETVDFNAGHSIISFDEVADLVKLFENNAYVTSVEYKGYTLTDIDVSAIADYADCLCEQD